MSHRARGHNRDDTGHWRGVVTADIVSAMRRAIRLSAETWPHPNPRVGAVVLDADGNRVGEAAHVCVGGPHAEPLALVAAGSAAVGGTVVVTLEPCNHHGRTPPCTEALIAAGVARVVVGAGDPDPRVAGSGIARLRSAGIDVVTDVLTEEIEAADPGYFHHRRTGRPLVTLKTAATLDGQVAAADGTSQWITSPEARRDVHRLRAASDVVMVGGGTLIADDPRLDVRIAGHDGNQPRPAVVLGTRAFPADAALADRNPLVFSAVAGDQAQPGAEHVVVGPDANGDTDLDAVLADLGARNVLDLFVEGGPTLAASFLARGYVDRLVIYYGPKIAGGVGRPAFDGTFPTLTSATSVVIDDVRMLGSDIRVVARPVTNRPHLTGAV